MELLRIKSLRACFLLYLDFIASPEAVKDYIPPMSIPGIHEKLEMLLYVVQLVYSVCSASSFLSAGDYN